MTTFTLKAFARQRGAIGGFYIVVTNIEADTLEAAKAILRAEYETQYVQEAQV